MNFYKFTKDPSKKPIWIENISKGREKIQEVEHLFVQITLLMVNQPGKTQNLPSSLPLEPTSMTVPQQKQSDLVEGYLKGIPLRQVERILGKRRKK